METAYEFIVVGCGGIGSAAAYWLSRVAGNEVLALEQFHIGHDNGASQDHSRIIRLSYHTPEYTALTPHTYTAWQEVEDESGVQLVYRTGGLDIAPEGTTALDAYASSMRAAGIPFDELSAAETMERFPQFRLDPTDRALFQAESGLVDPRKAIQTHVALARAHGATVLDNTPVRRVTPVGDGVEVETDAGTFTASRLVVTSDAWTNQVLEGVGVSYPLTVTQEQVTYFATPNLRDFAPDRFPIWIWHGESSGWFYGFPVYGEVATKAGEDVGGDVVTADTRTFEPNERPYDRLTAFLETYIPGSLGPVLYTKTCLYTMTPDRNFIIERVPECPQIAVALGAAHGFKFSCLIGQILSDLAVEGDTRYPIAPFTSNRPAIKDPSFPVEFSLSPAAD
ncbi:MAG TPA: N-methyl-L-tryptophan oxidase [Thermomicrobiales bacterium]|nr:N-methyl-L-tryptophan oxidase [Thermomicrobiales bacterium]